jgi:signal transduction histidine kinase
MAGVRILIATDREAVRIAQESLTNIHRHSGS